MCTLFTIKKDEVIWVVVYFNTTKVYFNELPDTLKSAVLYNFIFRCYLYLATLKVALKSDYIVVAASKNINCINRH